MACEEPFHKPYQQQSGHLHLGHSRNPETPEKDPTYQEQCKTFARKAPETAALSEDEAADAAWRSIRTPPEADKARGFRALGFEFRIWVFGCSVGCGLLTVLFTFVKYLARYNLELEGDQPFRPGRFLNQAEMLVLYFFRLWRRAGQ